VKEGTITALKKMEKIKLTAATLDLRDIGKVRVTQMEKNLLSGVIINREITKNASMILRNPVNKERELGALLWAYHKNLSKYLKVRIPLTDKTIRKGMKMGAWGGKINEDADALFFLIPFSLEEQFEEFLNKERLQYSIVRVGEGVR